MMVMMMHHIIYPRGTRRTRRRKARTKAATPKRNMQPYPSIVPI
jgi:hypothetical protein